MSLLVNSPKRNLKALCFEDIRAAAPIGPSLLGDMDTRWHFILFFSAGD